jgi:hypothetical protein
MQRNGGDGDYSDAEGLLACSGPFGNLSMEGRRYSYSEETPFARATGTTC